MRLSQFALGVAVVAAASAAVATAHAENGVYIPLMSYRTGPYSGAGAAIFNGMSDYLNMLNARDGGVGGARLIVEECETGYDTKKGVECYDSTKGKSPSPRVLTKVENVVTVEPVGEFELKGIRRPLAAYNVVAASPSKV